MSRMTRYMLSPLTRLLLCSVSSNVYDLLITDVKSGDAYVSRIHCTGQPAVFTHYLTLLSYLFSALLIIRVVDNAEYSDVHTLLLFC